MLLLATIIVLCTADTAPKKTWRGFSEEPSAYPLHFDGLDSGARITCGNWASFYTIMEAELEPYLEGIADSSEYLACFFHVFDGSSKRGDEATLLDDFPNYWEAGWNVNTRAGGLRLPLVSFCPDRAKFPPGSSVFFGLGCKSRDSPNRCGRYNPSDIPGLVASDDYCFTAVTDTFTFNWDIVITEPAEGESVNIVDDTIAFNYYVGESIREENDAAALAKASIVVREDDADGRYVTTLSLDDAIDVETDFVYGSARVTTTLRIPSSLPTPGTYHLTLEIDSVDAVPGTVTVDLWRVPLMGEQCNLAALGMVRSMASYGQDTRTANSIDPASTTPLPGCVITATNEPLELRGIIVYSSAQFHLSAYATPWLAQTYREVQNNGDVTARPLSGEDYDVDSSLKYLKAPGRELLVISFRGSTSWADWLSTNANLAHFPCDDANLGCSDLEDDDDSSGDLHAGIAREYLAVRQKLAYLYYILYGINGDGGTIDILYTGHSQGGAIAQLAAQDFHHFHKVDLGLDKVFHHGWFREPFVIDIESTRATFTTNVVTFGSPRVGFKNFVTTFGRMVGHEHYARFEGNGDVVPETLALYSSAGTQITLPCGYFNTASCHYLHTYATFLFKNEWQDTDEAKRLRLDNVLRYSPSLAASLRVSDGDEGGDGMSTMIIVIVASVSALCCCCVVAAAVASVAIAARRRDRRRAIGKVSTGTMSPAGTVSGTGPTRRTRSASRTSRTSIHRKSMTATSRPQPGL